MENLNAVYQWKDTPKRKVNVKAIATFYVIVNFHGEKYEKLFEVNASDYNESQQISYGDSYYTLHQTNPTQQKFKLLESCFNRSIILFENFFRSVMRADIYIFYQKSIIHYLSFISNT